MKTKATLIFAGLLLGLNMHAQYFSLDLDSKLFEFDKENEKVNTDIYTTADDDELKIYFGKDNYDDRLKEMKEADFSDTKVIINKEFKVGNDVYYCFINESRSRFAITDETEIFEYYFRPLDRDNAIVLTFIYPSEEKDKYKGVALKAFLSAKIKK